MTLVRFTFNQKYMSIESILELEGDEKLDYGLLPETMFVAGLNNVCDKLDAPGPGLPELYRLNRTKLISHLTDKAETLSEKLPSSITEEYVKNRLAVPAGGQSYMKPYREEEFTVINRSARVQCAIHLICSYLPKELHDELERAQE